MTWLLMLDLAKKADYELASVCFGYEHFVDGECNGSQSEAHKRGS